MTDQPRITCPRCGRTSYHPNDVEEGYCGNCHDWTSPPSPVLPPHDWPSPPRPDK